MDSYAVISLHPTGKEIRSVWKVGLLALVDREVFANLSKFARCAFQGFGTRWCLGQCLRCWQEGWDLTQMCGLGSNKAQLMRSINKSQQFPLSHDPGHVVPSSKERKHGCLTCAAILC